MILWEAIMKAKGILLLLTIDVINGGLPYERPPEYYDRQSYEAGYEDGFRDCQDYHRSQPSLFKKHRPKREDQRC